MPQVFVQLQVGATLLTKMFNLSVVPEQGDFIHYDENDESLKKPVLSRDLYPMNRVSVLLAPGHVSDQTEYIDDLKVQAWEEE